MRRIIKRIVLCSTVALGLLSFQATGTKLFTHNTYHPVQASRVYKGTSLSQQINQLAVQRQRYHHPSIAWNFRDIGGYNTANGRYHVKTRKLFLSSYIKNIGSKGARRLKQLHVRTDIDMRNESLSPTCIQKEPQPGENGHSDPHHINLRYLHYPVESSTMEQKDWAKVPSRHINNYYAEAKRFRYQYDMTPLAKNSYRRAFYALMKYTKGRHAIMFNCNSGRDRSACFAAIILSTLGVSKNNVVKNYLLTNHYSYQTPYSNQRKRIDTFFRTVHHKYGSVYNYDRRGLGLSRNFIHHFKKRFLVRN